MSLLLTPQRGRKPYVPVEMADAVEEWARKSGRHARIDWVMATDPPTPQVRISPVSGDPAKRKVQEGEWAPEEAEETVELVEWDEEERRYVPMNLQELGVTGLLELLRKGDTWSGRGEYDSIQEAVVAAREQAKREQQKLKKHLREEVRHAARQVRRRVMDLPLLRVGIEVGGESTTGEERP